MNNLLNFYNLNKLMLKLVLLTTYFDYSWKYSAISVKYFGVRFMIDILFAYWLNLVFVRLLGDFKVELII